ncbi:hypothetical protein ACB087_01240 [Vibrio sp. VNB-15]
MATKAQARALKLAGFRVWARTINPSAPVGKLRKPTLRWIVERLSIEQAGLILRQLRGEPKSSWVVALPARPFTQVDRAQSRAALQKELRRGR